jgi:uncharacterized membrane protein YfcA
LACELVGGHLYQYRTLQQAGATGLDGARVAQASCGGPTAKGVWEVLLAVPFGLAIGLVVGAVGGGGAILALPVLVYVLGEPVDPASTASLVVVAVAAAVGAGIPAREGRVCWGVALAFSVPAAAGSLAGTFANRGVSGSALILSFVPVMLVAATAMWIRAGATGGDDERGCPPPAPGRTLTAGLAVGVLTGFFGVGGGFMIVPVLTLLLGAGLRPAVATSLVIITLTGTAALVSHLIAGARLDAGVTLALAGPTAIGAVAGGLIGGRVPQAALGRVFAAVVAAVALFLVVDVLAFAGPPGA